MKTDFFIDGIDSGWIHHDASKLSENLTLEADVAIIGTGSGGGVSAEVLSKAGLKVVMIEEGPLKTPRDFKMLESDAYPNIYQESASRKTKDKGINIYQGRCVGGGSVVAWTTSFRTPLNTMAHWKEEFGVNGFTEDEMRPWFEKIEERLNIGPWEIPPNKNNDVLRRGAKKLGFSYGFMPRNVKDCIDLGYCGVGCPVSARQDMLVTTIPSALKDGATLVSRARAERLVYRKGKVESLECSAMDGNGIHPRKIRVNVKAGHYILSAGSIGSPSILLRSDIPDPNRLVGKRTFLHPTSASGAIMPEPVEGYYGAPQSVYSDHFLYPDDGSIGYKLEVPPIHPIFVATNICGYGKVHSELMKNLPNLQAIIVLMRDGFHKESPGGSVELKRDGTPLLDYPVTSYMWDGFSRSLLSCAEIQFAAGAKSVIPFHLDSPGYGNWNEAKREIPKLKMELFSQMVGSAHVMGGCPMGGYEKRSVVDSDCRHRHAENLFIFDASVFPTSIGANPQLSIFTLAAKQASRLAGEINR